MESKEIHIEANRQQGLRQSAPISRRFILAASSLLTVPAAVAQNQAPSNIQQARDQASRNADALAKVDLPRSSEPAFRFEA